MKQNKKILSIIILLILVFFFVGCVPPVPEVIDVTGVSITEEDQSINQS
ncbi:MAG: hypothetical protein R6V04_11345 [bacterium]